MENETVYKKICSIFYYYKNTKALIYYGNGSTYQNLLFLLCFLEEKGRLTFNSIEDLWFIKEIKNESLRKLILDLIKSLIWIIEDKEYNLAQDNIKLAKELLELKDSETFEIFKYFQSIFSNFTDESINIIYPLLYSIMFSKPQFNQYLKRDLMVVVKKPLEKLEVKDKIQYNNINKKFIKYFNALLNLKEEEMKLNCYEYLCEFDDNSKELEFSESFSYFSSLKEIIIDCEKNLIENASIISEECINKNGKNSNDSSEKTENNNSSEKNGSNNGSHNNGTTRESSTNDNEIQTNEKSKKEQIIQNTKEKETKIEKKTIEYNKEEKAKLNNDNSDIDLSKQYGTKVHIPTFQATMKVMLISNYCHKIPIIINSLKINKESVERYYDLVNKNTDNKILLNKLSTTILILQNANIINLKRKLVECLIFGILDKHPKSFEFENNDYYPTKYHLDELLKILENRKSHLPEDCDESKKKVIEEDIDRLENIIDKNNEPKINSKIIISHKNSATKHKLEMVMDFLRFCKKKLHPLVHAEGKNIDYYLLTNELFTSNLKRSDILFSLDDMIDKKTIKKSEIKLKLEELELDDNWEIYVQNKEISSDKALTILMQQKSFSLNDKNQVKMLNEIKKKMNKNLEAYNAYYNAFIQNPFTTLSRELIESVKTKNKEKDLVDLVNQYENDITKILKNEIEMSKALEKIETIIKTVKNETEGALEWFLKFSSFNINADSFEEILDSKINRVCIIAKFLEEQSKKFSERQKEIYNEFDMSAKNIIKKSETLRDLIQAFTIVEEENLFDKWLETSPEFDEKFLNVRWMRNDTLDLIHSVELNVSYTFDEKFVLWMIKNNFSKYLKNNF